MASRLMLSLKKAAIGPAMPWSLATMTNFGRGMSQEVRTVRFAPRTLSRSRETSETPNLPNEGDIELVSILWNRG